MKNVNWHKKTMKKQKGFTLIEIMLSLLLGIIVIGGVLSIYVSTIRGSIDTTRAVRLNHDINSIMQIMVNDIKRAGYWGNAVAFTPAGVINTQNPFMNNVATATLPISNIQALAFNGVASSCFLYSYDVNNSGHFDNDGDGTVDDTNEFYGFRLNNGNLEMRLSGNTTADCTQGTWRSFINTSVVQITTLSFTLTTKCQDVTNAADASANCAAIPPGNRAADVRYVRINLSGRLVAENAVAKTLTENIQLRNNRIYLAP